MQKQLIGIILCLLAYCYAYEWEHVYTATGQYEHFNKLYFFSPDTGFAVGYGITATTDGGQTWTKVTDDITVTSNITFTDRKHGFACGGYPYAWPFLRRTVDGGNNWQTIQLPESLDVYGYENILFLDSLTGFLPGAISVVGEYPNYYCHGQILKTIDGGNTWKRVFQSDTDHINKIAVDPASGHLYAVGGPNPGPQRALLAKSYDNGENWRVTLLDTISYHLTDIQFFDNTTIYTSNNRVFCKIDSALNITYLFTRNSVYGQPDSVSFFNIDFIDNQKGFAYAGNSGNFIPFCSTSDGGLSWDKEIIPDDPTIKFYDVFKTDSIIYMATSNKLFNTSTTTSINHLELNKTDNLLTCYPNPFNPATLINYTLARAGNIDLSIYNAKGELISRLYHGTQLAGVHRATFNAIGLNSGVYFVRLSGEKINVNKKVLLIK